MTLTVQSLLAFVLQNGSNNGVSYHSFNRIAGIIRGETQLEGQNG